MAENNTNTVKSMLFIGNGFDVAHGYKTRYRDFYENCHELKKSANNDNLLCKHILENISGEMWKDLECGLFQYSKMLTAKNGEGDGTSTERFKKEFKELRSILFLYIKKAISVSVSDNPGYFVSKLSEEWMKLEYQIISFNYSPIVAAYTTDAKKYSSGLSFSSDKLIFQHGSIYNAEKGTENTPDNIVLGIDDSQKVEKAHSFLYKSIQNLYNVNNLTQSMQDKDVYIVYGCSMGASDSFYFKQLFDDNKKNKTYLIYGFGESSLDSIKENVIEYLGSINEYKVNNHIEIEFIDCSLRSALSKTHNAIDLALQKKLVL